MPEKRMPPKLDSEIKRLQLVIGKRLLLRIDDWRAHQPGVPNVSVAIRKLIELGLDAAGRHGKATKPKV
jgi:hypothetical protein